MAWLLLPKRNLFIYLTITFSKKVYALQSATTSYPEPLGKITNDIIPKTIYKMTNRYFSNQSTQMGAKVGNWVSPNLDKFESVLFIISLIGLVLKIISIAFGSFILTFSIILLANLYFFDSL